MPFYMKINLQENNNKSSLNMELFNDELNLIMTMILSIILIFLSTNYKNKMNSSMKMIKESSSLEMFWTIIPTSIIMLISIPSIMCLYMNEESKKPTNHMIISGNQWYWSYKMNNKSSMNSYIFNSKLNRNLSTDFSILMKSKKTTRLMFSSNDVIHSWTIPSLMVKMDCIPGRMNSMIMETKKTMKMKGQCSELCGANHSFMPISLMVMSLKKNNFLN